jgi:hypothetical protein
VTALLRQRRGNWGPILLPCVADVYGCLYARLLCLPPELPSNPSATVPFPFPLSSASPQLASNSPTHRAFSYLLYRTLPKLAPGPCAPCNTLEPQQAPPSCQEVPGLRSGNLWQLTSARRHSGTKMPLFAVSSGLRERVNCDGHLPCVVSRAGGGVPQASAVFQAALQATGPKLFADLSRATGAAACRPPSVRAGPRRTAAPTPTVSGCAGARGCCSSMHCSTSHHTSAKQVCIKGHQERHALGGRSATHQLIPKWLLCVPYTPQARRYLSSCDACWRKGSLCASCGGAGCTCGTASSL